MLCPERHLRSERGVTLIEMVIVIAITAIIASAVAVFISRPVEGYADAARRAEMTDIADTALRRMTRDLRAALSNSIRTTTVSGVVYLEYLQSSGGGRYRAQVDSGGLGDPLDFTAPDASFDVIGAMPTLAAGDSIVIYNLGPGSGTSDAYAAPPNNNRAAYSSNTASAITIAPAKQFPFPSPGKRFQVVQQPVTYACDPVGGTVRRIAGYAIQAAQPNNVAAAPLSTAPNNVLLATNVAACSFTYVTSGVAQRAGVVSLSLQIQESGSADSIWLFQQVHVTNVP
jgi:MSHA biogenesis protein MshO